MTIQDATVKDILNDIRESQKEIRDDQKELIERITRLEARVPLSDDIAIRFRAVEQLAGNLDGRITVHLAQEHHNATKIELDAHDRRITVLERNQAILNAIAEETKATRRWLVMITFGLLGDLIVAGSALVHR